MTAATFKSGEPGAPCAPPPDDTVIWRYFDFAKFVSLLDRKALFFASASNLEDPFEGSIPFADFENSFPPAENPDNNEEAERRKWRRNLILVSSWHINSDESFAMWKLYSKSIEAIAIRTTVGKLKRCLVQRPDFEVIIGKVEYLDYRQDQISDRHHLAPFLRKARPYSYENEVRAIVDLYGRHVKGREHEASVKNSALLARVFRDRGIYVGVDLDQLVEGVYVSPMAGEWFRELVARVIGRFEIQREPRHSVLSEKPVY